MPAHPSVAITIAESDEPLVPLPREVIELAYYANERWPGASKSLRARESVSSRLAAAAVRLPADFGIVVLDAWRSTQFQRALYEHYYRDSSLAPGFVSDPEHQLWIPPHETGGALDVSLTWKGQPLSLGTEFDSFTHKARLDAYEGSRDAEPFRSLRRLLVAALTAVDFCPYPEEWWHFSYGDQHWAYNKGLPAAPYGRVGPDGD
ncbi:MAG: hypothetical protein HY071_03175 [Chloroflexi bacterium]|nr:hypothetical protein [Chloroflexota bacterium]